MLVKPLESGTRIRDAHNTYGVIKYIVGPDDLISGTDIFIAPENIVDPKTNSVIQKAGDQWLAVEKVNGSSVTGWIAITHLGNEISAEVPDIPIPPTESPEPWVKLTYSNGKEYYYDLRPGQ